MKRDNLYYLRRACQRFVTTSTGKTVSRVSPLIYCFVPGPCAPLPRSVLPSDWIYLWSLRTLALFGSIHRPRLGLTYPPTQVSIGPPVSTKRGAIRYFRLNFRYNLTLYPTLSTRIKGLVNSGCTPRTFWSLSVGTTVPEVNVSPPPTTHNLTQETFHRTQGRGVMNICTAINLYLGNVYIRSILLQCHLIHPGFWLLTPGIYFRYTSVRFCVSYSGTSLPPSLTLVRRRSVASCSPGRR